MKVGQLGNVLLAVAVFSPACAAGSESRPCDVAFVNVNVVPMDQEQVLAGQTVLVRGERIAAIGPAASVKIPEGAIQVDGAGRYLMPGLADMHLHRGNPEDALLYLANGVTTVRDMDGNPVHLRWRRQLASGQMLGPTVDPGFPTRRRCLENWALRISSGS